MARKFGGFVGGPGANEPQPSESGKQVVTGSTGGLPTAAKSGEERLSRLGAKPAFAIALDATGSMAPRIKDACEQIAEILKRVRKLLGQPIQVQFYCYRDYDVFHPANYAPSDLLAVSPMSEDSQLLSSWVSNVKAEYGGDNFGEAIETALESIHGVTASGTRISAVLLVGDEPSNRRVDLDQLGRNQTKTAHDWARAFGARKVPIHAFVIIGNKDTAIPDFEEIARLSGGQAGRLNQSDSMLNMAALAMVSAVGGASAVKDYENRYQLSGPDKAFADRLRLTGPGR